VFAAFYRIRAVSGASNSDTLEMAPSCTAARRTAVGWRPRHPPNASEEPASLRYHPVEDERVSATT
jgi:hypothetical protein